MEARRSLWLREAFAPSQGEAVRAGNSPRVVRFVLVVNVFFLHGAAMPVSREPLQRRGARACAAARAYVSPLINRLHVHAVDDNTNQGYQRHVRAFLIDVKRHQIGLAILV